MVAGEALTTEMIAPRVGPAERGSLPLPLGASLWGWGTSGGYGARGYAGAPLAVHRHEAALPAHRRGAW